MTDYITKQTVLPTYMMYPKFLLTLPISETAKLIYIMLLDRARLSASKGDYTDKNGHVYIYYPIEDIADDIHKSRTTVKNALAALETSKLILRVHQSIGQASKIYVKIIRETEDKNMSVTRTENRLSEDSFLSNQGQKIVLSEGRKVSGNKNEINKNNIARIKEREGRTAYGSYKNVFLSDDEYRALHMEFSSCDEYIERLSVYMTSKGRNYTNHAATIRKWILEDKPKKQERSYDCKEDESL
ncbi:MAG: replication initiator protein A [Clostridia bacterium]